MIDEHLNASLLLERMARAQLEVTQLTKKLTRSLALERLIPNVFHDGAISTRWTGQFDRRELIIKRGNGTVHVVKFEDVPWELR